MTDKKIVLLIAGMVLPLFHNAIRKMLDLVCEALRKWLGLEGRSPVLPPTRPAVTQLPPRRSRRRRTDD